MTKTSATPKDTTNPTETAGAQGIAPEVSGMAVGDGWREVKFSDLLIDESISYGIVQPGFHTENDSVPIVRVNNIKSGKINVSDVLKVASKIESKYQRTRLFGGELLITVVGSIGECAVVPNELKGWNVARAVSVARIKPGYEIDFVKYSFLTEDVKFQMYGNTNDTVQPTLNLSSIKNLIFRLPPLTEQKAIAAVLSSLDDKIDLLHRQNQTLEAMAQTLFRQWFIEEAREDWEDGFLLDIALNIKDSIQPAEMNGDMAYVGLEHISRKSIALNQWGKVSDVSSNKYCFAQRDILFGKLRPYFHKVCFAPFFGVCSTDILVIRPKKESWFAFCLFAFFQDDVVEYANIGSGGTRMPRTDWGTLGQYEIRLPDEAVIERFNQISLPLLQKIEQNLQQIQTLTQLRDTLLPKLMSGEVRII